MLLLVWMMIISMPVISYSQNRSVESGLSPAAQLLVEQAKQNPAGKTIKSRSLGFNLAITSRFDGGMMMDIGSLPFEYDFFNVTSLEFYFPSYHKTRLLATFRFSTPLLIHDYCNPLRTGLYQQRLGWGIGFSHTILDNRDLQGRGLMLAFQMLTAFDYLFLDYGDLVSNSPITEYRTMYRLELGMRINKFVAKNLALVLGFDMSGGMARGVMNHAIGNDGYPLEPLKPYGRYYRGVFTLGVTAGIMF
ncbi:MAG: hypothetical protein ACRC0X_08415 [Brevinema sp.]